MKTFQLSILLGLLTTLGGNAVLADDQSGASSLPSGLARVRNQRFGSRDGNTLTRRPVFGLRQSGVQSADPYRSILSNPTSGSNKSILNDQNLFSGQQQNRGPIKLKNGGTMNISSDGSRQLLNKDGSRLMTPGSSFGTRPDGSSFSRSQDGARTFTTKDGKFGQINSDGTGPRPDGSVVSKNAAEGSTTVAKNGYKFTHKQDGSAVFTRSNGIETEFKDGHIRMKQDGQYTNRQIK